VSSSNQFCESSFSLTGITAPVESPQWYAIHTRARHEKAVVAQMQNHGITTFLPLVTQVHRWSDRRKVVQLPLFSCYAFVRLLPRPEFQVKVLQTDGVLRFVGPRGQGAAIPDREVENIRTLQASSAQYTSYPFLKVGQRVRVRGGALDGIEGILISRNGDRTLVISVEPIQRSLAIPISDYQVEAI
jgi:transcription antitermination factor NusG